MTWRIWKTWITWRTSCRRLKTVYLWLKTLYYSTRWLKTLCLSTRWLKSLYLWHSFWRLKKLESALLLDPIFSSFFAIAKMSCKVHKPPPPPPTINWPFGRGKNAPNHPCNQLSSLSIIRWSNAAKAQSWPVSSMLPLSSPLTALTVSRVQKSNKLLHQE